MHRGIGHGIPTNEFVLFIHIDVIFIAIVTDAPFDGPAGFGIFLPPLRWLVFPVSRADARLQHGIFLTRIALFGHRDQGGITISWPPRAWKPWSPR